MTQSGIEPATFRIVAQRLTNCANAFVRGRATAVVRGRATAVVRGRATAVGGGRATAVGGGSSNPQASAPGYIKLVAVAEIRKLVVPVQ